MKILMKKRKGGCYTERFIVEGLDERGRETRFVIFPSQAKTYPQAVRFWNKTWGKTCKAFILRNSEPLSNNLAYCA